MNSCRIKISIKVLLLMHGIASKHFIEYFILISAGKAHTRKCFYKIWKTVVGFASWLVSRDIEAILSN